jgi:hypothetical protein
MALEAGEGQLQVSGNQLLPVESDSRFHGKERRNRWQTLGIPKSIFNPSGTEHLQSWHEWLLESDQPSRLGPSLTQGPQARVSAQGPHL